MTTNTTRRGILVGLPAIAGLVPATAAPADPIFALIAEYKRAWQEYCEAAGEYTGRLMGWEAFPDLYKAYTATIHGLESTVPTTLPGAAALLTFWIDDNPLEDGTSDWHAPVLNNVLTALERLAG